MAKALSVKSVDAARPNPAKRIEIGDGLLPGLQLVVQPSGAKSWALRYRRHGKTAKLTLGPVLIERKDDAVTGLIPVGQAMTLAEARAAGREALQQLAEGKDPAAAAKRSSAHKSALPDRNRDLVRVQAETFISRYCKPRNRSWPEVERQFKTVINPTWGERRVQDIAKRDVTDLLDEIVDRGAPVLANRVFATIRKFFGWLVERDVLKVSPCAGLKSPSSEKSRDRLLDDDEIRLFLKATQGLGYPFGPMFRLLLFTAQRKSEVGNMSRGELAIAGVKPLWVIPADRAKNGKEHEVPLSESAISMIKALPQIGDSQLLFTTTGETSASGFSRALERTNFKMLELRREEVTKRGDDPEKVTPIPRWTLHDLRRTAASGMARLGVSLPIIEKILNHTSGSFGGIVGVYQKHSFADEKRAALDAWAAQLQRIESAKARDR